MPRGRINKLGCTADAGSITFRLNAEGQVALRAAAMAEGLRVSEFVRLVVARAVAGLMHDKGRVDAILSDIFHLEQRATEPATGRRDLTYEPDDAQGVG